MNKNQETFFNVIAQLDVVEVKLDELLKRFGVDDEELWDIGEHVFQKSIERLREENRESSETLEQPELF